MTIRTTVWGENVHDRENEVVREIYPKGMHGCIADALNADPTSRRPPRRWNSPSTG